MGMKWTAFLRLTGETQARNSNPMPSEFIGLIQFLQGVNADYGLIVLVEPEGSRVVHPLNSDQSFEAWAQGEEDGT